mgnify:CR=1 FL=1
MTKPVHIIGGGLAGSEAAWQLANRGVPVTLYEMRGPHKTAVHKTDKLAELVCSNSFRGTDESKNAVALLHAELRDMGSLVMQSAEQHRVPAGGALAIDREPFSQFITDSLENHPLVTIKREEVTNLPTDELVLVATGPLTSSKLAEHIINLTGSDRLAFFDAVAPIVQADSVDMSICWKQSRYDKGDGADYINCPMTKEQYYTFVEAIINAEQSIGHNPEDKDVPYFEGCLPIEVMAERGIETLRHGPMKPRGLTNAHKPDEKPYAVVQLRQDNKLGTLYNMVGFQTRMKWGEQKRIFKTIPGLENADFARFGVIHKNTFINSPTLLDEQMRLKAQPNLRFAGQFTGVEGYVESTSMGCMAGLFMAAEILGNAVTPPPATTAMGALINHITGGADAKTFQPMNITFGLLPPLEQKTTKKERKPAYSRRARIDFTHWLQGTPLAQNQSPHKQSA